MVHDNLQLSHEATSIKRSVLRELLSLAVDPEIISMAGGLPANETMPVEEMRQCINTVLDRDGARAMQYSPQYEPLKAWIAEYMGKKGVECDVDSVFLTSGAQQGLAILSRLFLDPGDPAVVEEVTFTGVQQITKGRGAEVRTIPTDFTSGADMEAMEQAFRREPRPRLTVLIPDFHNPLGVTLSGEKRARAAELAATYRVPLLEDDPYSALRFVGEPSPPIKAFDEAGFVFYIGSFSKILAPAVRLGWIVAPPALIPKITVLRESLDLESSALIQRAVFDFIEQGFLEPYLKTLRAINRERQKALDEALREHLGEMATWTLPEGGLFSWVTLAEGMDTWEMFTAAIERKFAYIPGTAFATNGGYTNTMRLNFSTSKPEAIQEAIRRLAAVVGDQMSISPG